ncbi:MAG: monogalactosyldiacylglycerol synthase [Parcubacteria group bacterium Athens1014_10]|nr:MAG: monogalactosyldiacylglycerol synthase [Parcubacteria group bacterium Athens1014_10]TSD04748.1 MAG: monogalactosyldiacylglycerol synthase [Parcubacteria group bacterium Athens0714_12]
MAKKVLLIYITAYSGHHRASLAIEGALKKLSEEIEILNIDFLEYFHPLSAKILNSLYFQVVKNMPQGWKYIYNNQKIYKRLLKSGKILGFLKSLKLKKLIYGFKPDVIVCTQAYPAWLLAEYKRRKNLDTPIIGVLTDYLPHLYWAHSHINRYIVPSLPAKKILMEMGIQESKINNFGIPIDARFFQPIDGNGVIEKIGLNKFLSIILIMGGGQGIGPIKNIIKIFNRFRFFPLQMIIVCGKNKKLERQIKQEFNISYHPLKVFGYAENINELMKISSLIITKAGGLTVSEALACHLPMIIVDPIPGQEANNVQFLLKKGLILASKNGEDAARLALGLLADHRKLKRMRFKIKKFNKTDSAAAIASLILNY